MTCFHCQGELRKGKTSYAINRKGYHLIIDDMPAWICEQCGELLFEEEQVNAIQQLIQAADPKVESLIRAA